MSFRVRTEQHPNSFGKDSNVWVAEDDHGNRLDVWPALGFNAFRWTAGGTDLLYCDPGFFQEQRPSRSGFPILFPFPNRIRDGHFTWNGREYSLPTNDPAKKNAIHGFALNADWQMAEPKIANDVVELTAHFRAAANWPAEPAMRVTYRLGRGFLEVIAAVVTDVPLPMGLGYHPYFLLEPFGGADARPWVAARKMWELEANLPTGKLLDPAGEKDYSVPQPVAERKPDDVYTSLDPRGTRTGLDLIAGITNAGGGKRLEMWTSPEFREIVVFVPPHRKAIAIEPYTCTTDAINLQARGADAGWLVVPPQRLWEATVRLEYRA
jgi:aldose 1-epimerase